MAELLVVTGVIAVLLALLIPAMSAARRHAERVTCMSNLRQTAMAYIAYSMEHRGDLPGSARRSAVREDDYLHWQPERNVRQSALARHLGGDPTWAMRCPSDDLERLAGYRYRFSFVLNLFFDADPDTSVFPAELFAYRLTGLPRSSEKVLFYEQDSARLDDGVGNPRSAPLAADLLSTRHDAGASSDAPPAPLLPPDTAWIRLPNMDRAGNVAFVDGHAEFITRELMHNPRYYLPGAP